MTRVSVTYWGDKGVFYRRDTSIGRDVGTGKYFMRGEHRSCKEWSGGRKRFGAAGRGDNLNTREQSLLRSNM